MKRRSAAPNIEGYVRLSRDDPDSQEPLEVRLNLRVGIIKTLAKQHGHALTDDLIYTEVESGGTIDKRPIFKAQLERAERGQIDFLYSAYQDRVLRGDKADEQRIEDAFVLGNVVLVTTEDETDFGDENYDPLPFEVRSLIARYERRGYIKKRRETNRQRARQGMRVNSTAPYGFQWIKAVYDGRTLVTPAHYRLVPAEYAIVCEIFRRIKTDSLRTIARDLTERYRREGQPVPPSQATATRKNLTQPCHVWHPRTLHNILLNSLYAGYPVSGKQKVTRKGKRVDVHPSDWIIAEEIQTFRHPEPPAGQEEHHWRIVTLAEQREIAETLIGRMKGTPRTTSEYLLTGLLQCSKERSMAGCNGNYICGCITQHETHPGTRVAAFKVHTAAYQALEAVILALPSELISAKPQKTDRARLHNDYDTAERELRDAQENAHDLILNRRRHIANYGETVYDATCQRNAEMLKSWTAKRNELRLLLDTPDLADVLPLLERVRERGLAWYWKRWTAAEKRDALRQVIAKMELVGKERALEHTKQVTLTFHEWVGKYYSETLFDLPRRNADKSTLIE